MIHRTSSLSTGSRKASAFGHRPLYHTRAGAELDIFVPSAKGNIGIEAKYGDAPGSTKPMRIAIQDLQLRKLLVVYPGPQAYDIDEKIRLIPLRDLRPEIEALQNSGTAPAL